MNPSKARRVARGRGGVGMTTPVRCEKHLFEDAAGTCHACRRPYCDECLVYIQGPDRPALCVPCALRKAGVRSTTRSQRSGIH